MTCNYNAEDKNVMKVSAQAKNKSRLQELIDFAKISGFKKIGVANCKGVQELADRFIALLREQGLEVVSVNCKESGLDGCEICDEMKGPCCDPISQAVFLNEQGTDFNVNFGLCLGHGLLFQKYSKVPVTTFLVKDFAHNHNVVESLMA
ncbi:MAG: DUF1847 domain-containing protein [Alphaproteobacteria bacterium]|nr:DUF1847 domain-containing protein [Alphaproteobacteria bacterium]CDB52927.1 uncharacterized protein BN554_01284 [Azospirillum sp. CAG:239]